MTDKNQKQYLFTLTHFEGDPDRVATPLVLANNALAASGDVLVWVPLEAVKLAKQDAANGLIPKSFPPCAKTHGVTQENMLANAEFMGGAAVIGAAENRQTFSF